MMRKFRAIIILFIFMSALSTALLFKLNTKAEAVGTAVSIRSFYPIPASDGKPFQLAVESTGSPKIVWFTMPADDAIGELVITSTTDFEVNTFSLGAGSEPYDIVFDGVNKVWFTQAGSGEIGNIDVNTNVITEIAIPSGNNPRGIDISPDEKIWFVQNGTNFVTSYDPNNPAFIDYAYSMPNGDLEELEVLNNNAIWVSAPGENRISKLDPSGPTFSNVPLQLIPGSATFSPSGLTLDAGEPWASASSDGLIGRHAPGTLSFWIWFQIGITNFSPTRIDYQEMASSKFIWFIDPTNGLAGRLQTDVNGSFEGFNYTGFSDGAAANPTDIVVDSSDVVWVVNNGSGEIMQWNPPYFEFVYLPVIQK